MSRLDPWPWISTRRKAVGFGVVAVALLSLVSWASVGLSPPSRAELVSLTPGVNAHPRLSALERRREKMEKKLAADEASAKGAAQRKEAKTEHEDEHIGHCGRLCRAKKAILQVKGELDNKADAAMQQLACGCHKVRRAHPVCGHICARHHHHHLHLAARTTVVPTHTIIQPIINPVQPLVAQAVVQPYKQTVVQPVIKTTVNAPPIYQTTYTPQKVVTRVVNPPPLVRTVYKPPTVKTTIVKPTYHQVIAPQVTRVVVPVSEVHPKGPKGEKGESGDKGEKGERGPPGWDGAKGERGPPGPAGRDGLSGREGPRGRRGLKGKDGRPGIEGREGREGRVGPQGPQGFQGQRGQPGPQGGRPIEVSIPPKMEMDVRVMRTQVPGPCQSCGNHVEDCAPECTQCDASKPTSLCEHPTCIQCHARLQAKQQQQLMQQQGKQQQQLAAAKSGGVLTMGDLKAAVHKIEEAATATVSKGKAAAGGPEQQSEATAGSEALKGGACVDSKTWTGPYGDKCKQYANGGDRAFWCKWDGAGEKHACPVSCGTCDAIMERELKQREARWGTMLAQSEQKSGKGAVGKLKKDVSTLKQRLMQIAKATGLSQNKGSKTPGDQEDGGETSSQAANDLHSFFSNLGEAGGAAKPWVSAKDAEDDMTSWFDTLTTGKQAKKVVKKPAANKVEGSGHKGVFSAKQNAYFLQVESAYGPQAERLAEEAALAGMHAKKSRRGRGAETGGHKAKGGGGHMTGQEAASDLGKFWNKMPREAVHVRFGGSQGEKKVQEPTVVAAKKPKAAAKPAATGLAKVGRSGLPKGWHKGHDAKNRVYYYNSRTGDSRWDPPPGTILPSKKHPAAAHRKAAKEAKRGRNGDNGDGGGDSRGDAGDGHGSLTGKEAAKDFNGFLEGLVSSAKRAHDKAERAMERRREGRAGQYVTGSMSAKQAQDSLNSYWDKFPTPKPEEAPKRQHKAEVGSKGHRGAAVAGGASGGGSIDALGLPRGGNAAVSAPLHRVSSAAAHKSIDGYFDRLVHHAKLADTYHEKARAERTSMAAARLKEQEHVAYELDQEAKARAKQAAAAPPPPPPQVSPQQAYYSQTYNNFLSQVSQQASAQLNAPPEQHPWMQAPVQQQQQAVQQQQQQQQPHTTASVEGEEHAGLYRAMNPTPIEEAGAMGAGHPVPQGKQGGGGLQRMYAQQIVKAAES